MIGPRDSKSGDFFKARFAMGHFNHIYSRVETEKLFSGSIHHIDYFF